MSVDPFARQKLLPEVGERGQQLLRDAALDVPAGPSAEVAIDYLRRAGVGRVRLTEGAADTFPHAAFFRHAASHELGRGAWQALERIRGVLRLSPRPPAP